MLDHSGARILLADRRHLEMAERIRARMPSVRVVLQGGSAPSVDAYEELLDAATRLTLDPEAMGERSLISINYTSGTTARPKGVMLTHRNAYLNAVNMLLASGLRAEDVHLHVAPMFHANGWGFVWATLAVGAANVVLPRVDPGAVFESIAQNAVTSFCAA
ncbi:AMP-dependent synthetase and ligase, partial [mine drainage metagenome]